MKRLARLISVGFLLSGLLSAQQQPGPTDAFLEKFLHDLTFREMDIRRSDIERDIALRRHAEYLEMQFVARVNRFTELWSAMVQDYNEKRVFNFKIAAEVTKAFHEIESSDGWLKAAPKAKK
jgi:hypothetical protein